MLELVGAIERLEELTVLELPVAGLAGLDGMDVAADQLAEHHTDRALGRDLLERQPRRLIDAHAGAVITTLRAAPPDSRGAGGRDANGGARLGVPATGHAVMVARPPGWNRADAPLRSLTC